MGEGVRRNFMAIVNLGDFMGLNFVVKYPFAENIKASVLAEQLGIEIKRCFSIISVEDFNQSNILRNTVVIAECDGFHFAAEHYYILL